MKKSIKIMKIMFIFSLLVAGIWKNAKIANVSAEENESKRFIMYYGDWSMNDSQGNFNPDQMPAQYYTHLNYAFIDFDENGDLVFTDEQAALEAAAGMPNVNEGDVNSGLFTSFQRLKQNNPNLKIGISLGGWTKSGDFSLVCADDEKRANLVEQTLKLIEYTDMDFVDIDWEYPGNVRQPDLIDNAGDEGTPNASPADRENYIKLLQDLRDSLDTQGETLGKEYELSVAVSANPNVIAEGTDIAAVFNIVDFANIMTYDMHGAWNDFSGHHTNLYANPNDRASRSVSIDDSVQYYLSEGVPADKIVIGAAYYTRGWEKITAGTEADANQPGLYGTAERAAGTWQLGALNETPLVSGDGGWRAGIWSYRNIDKLKETYGVEEYWDDVAKAPYLYSPTTGAFFTYDNVRSVTEKANYVNTEDLGGIIVWMASQEGAEEQVLSSAIYENLFVNDVRPINQNAFTHLDISAELVQEDTKAIITLTNNETVIETNDLIKELELRQKTIKLPTIILENETIIGENNSDDVFIAPGESATFTIDISEGADTITDIFVQERFTTADDPYRFYHIQDFEYQDNRTIAPIEKEPEIVESIPVTPSKPTVVGNVTTGDSTDNTLIFTMLSASIIVMIGIGVNKKKITSK